MVILRRYDATAAAAAARHVDDLAALLVDAVDHGASVSYLPPMAIDEARRFYARVIDDVAAGRKLLIVAEVDDRLVGTVQLELAGVPNGAHRAEVQKLLVHSSARRRGVGRLLMEDVEEAAEEAGRTLLVLDTAQGDAAEPLYRKLGWLEVGVIPDYALTPAGRCATVIFYKPLSRR